jgi:putative PIN family toxin of toxin-antitoxin system
MIRAVLDANVVVSAILNAQGTPGRVFDAWRAERYQLLMSDAILEEIGRVLRYPKITKRHQWSPARVQQFLVLLADITILTPGDLALSVVVEDPEDNRYLECAVEGHANYIVSGDQDLLQLGSYQGILIVTPRAFLDMLNNL